MIKMNTYDSSPYDFNWDDNKIRFVKIGCPHEYLVLNNNKMMYHSTRDKTGMWVVKDNTGKEIDKDSFRSDLFERLTMIIKGEKLPLKK